MSTAFVVPDRHPHTLKFREAYAARIWPTGAQALASREQLAKPAVSKPAEAAPPAATPTPPGKKFVDAFGEQGAVWYIEGKTFDEAFALSTESLLAKIGQQEAELSRLQNQIDAKQYRNALGDTGTARFAAGIRLPGQQPTSARSQSVSHAAKAGEQGSAIPAGLRNAFGPATGLARFAAGIEVPGSAVVE